MPEVDYLIVGAGLFGSVFAYEANKLGYKVKVIDQRNHIGGNCYTENVNGIEVHKYGAHIFHTSNKKIWQYINQFGKFDDFVNQPIAIVGDTTYNLPFNMNTFSKIFGVTKPHEAIERIKQEQLEFKGKPTNLEERAIAEVGRTIYELLIKNYTEKQWGKKCTELPPDIIKRLPVRFAYDNNYFNDTYQGIPRYGYTKLFENMLEGIDVELNQKYLHSHFNAKKCIYTGMIDEFFDYRLGELEYRSLKFVEVEKKSFNYQGNAVVNYPDKNVAYIRSIEHKHFDKRNVTPNTIISYEFSMDYQKGMIPFYPVHTERNQIMYQGYLELAKQYPNIHFSGRLGSFRYYDMDDTIESVLLLVNSIL